MHRLLEIGKLNQKSFRKIKWKVKYTVTTSHPQDSLATMLFISISLSPLLFPEGEPDGYGLQLLTNDKWLSLYLTALIDL